MDTRNNFQRTVFKRQRTGYKGERIRAGQKGYAKGYRSSEPEERTGHAVDGSRPLYRPLKRKRSALEAATEPREDQWCLASAKLLSTASRC
jgi:hypothetical protein